jgi:hypothetical protein
MVGEIMVVYWKDLTLSGQNAQYIVFYVQLSLFFKWLTRLCHASYILVDYMLFKKTVSTQQIVHAV